MLQHSTAGKTAAAGAAQQRPGSGSQQTAQKRTSQQGQAQQSVKQAAAGTPTAAAAATAKSCPAAGGSSNKPAAGSTSPASPSTAAAGVASPAGPSPAATHQQQQQQAELHAQLEQLDLAALKPWVLQHFCEDVYLLLLDVWRPGSAKVGDAIWAWKLHVRQPQQGGAPADYRAFLVSLFGLEKLLQLTAAAQSRTGAVSPAAAAALPAPVPVLARQGTAGVSGNSSVADAATVMVTAGSTAGALATAGSAIGGALMVPGAASPAAAAAGKAVQLQAA
jgi:hypothetical protein